ncbi:MAG: PKD domain-containing protein [Bacteroidales bacterium]|nr:PKD domain-containing protein [Bacteroidales bacterium]
MKKIPNLLALLALASMAAASCDKNGDTFSDILAINDVPQQKPVPGFIYRTAGLDVQFINTSQGSSSYEWDFGDGYGSTEEFPKHTYSESGDYTVRLTISNSTDETASAEEVLSIRVEAEAIFTYRPRSGRGGLFGRIIDFDASSSKNLASLSWDFGDGTVTKAGLEYKTSHEYSSYGKYIVKAVGTGLYGDIVEQTLEVTVEPYTELLQGGGMETSDAAFWTFKDHWSADGNYGDAVGVPAFAAEFGYKNDGPSSMKGGCLRLGGENQPHDYSYSATFYQPIEVEEGDVLEIAADIKWGGKSMDSGVMFLCISDNADTFGTDDTAILQMFNYWNAGGTPLPPFDGNLAGKGLPEDSGYSGDGSHALRYTVSATGIIYFGFELRSVWGLWGPEVQFYFDNLSVKIVLD